MILTHLYLCDASKSATSAIVIIWQEEFTDKVQVCCNKYLCVICSGNCFSSTTTGYLILLSGSSLVVWQYASDTAANRYQRICLKNVIYTENEYVESKSEAIE